VYHAVRRRILEDQLPPGEFIREKDLNEALGVSRTPIREALGRLASEGFLERIPHRGFRVPEESLSGLLELYPIVSSLELLAGELALPRLTDRDMARLEEINDALHLAKEREDVQALIELNNQFHHLFSERSGNERLSKLLADLRAQLTRLEFWYYSDEEHAEQSIRQHSEIIRAIQDEDRDRALHLFERNMALTHERLLAETDGEAHAGS
jgi:DNA-binding GntR family transcriptional regulator